MVKVLHISWWAWWVYYFASALRYGLPSRWACWWQRRVWKVRWVFIFDGRLRQSKNLDLRESFSRSAFGTRYALKFRIAFCFPCLAHLIFGSSFLWYHFLGLRSCIFCGRTPSSAFCSPNYCLAICQPSLYSSKATALPSQPR